MTDPISDDEFRQLRDIPFTTGCRAYFGKFVDDEERDLYQLAAKNHNARLRLIQEVEWLRRRYDVQAAHVEARATRELLHALRLAVVTIRAAWVEARHIGAEEGIEVLEELVLATAGDLPDLDQYDGAQAVFDAEYGAADRTADAKKFRAQIVAKEAGRD